MASKNEDVLNGLDQIARYMDVTTRTILRWEAAHELPLLRPAGQSKTYAYKSQLEQWRRGEWPPKT